MNYELKLKTGERYWLSSDEYNKLLNLDVKNRFFYIERISKSVNVDSIHTFGIPDAMRQEAVKDAKEFRDGVNCLYAKVENEKGKDEWRKYEDNMWKKVVNVLDQEYINVSKTVDEVVSVSAEKKELQIKKK